MAWKCGECGAIENKKETETEQEVKVNVVCHHCGKLLCQKHRVLINDDHFDGDGVKAYHCKKCKEKFHP